MTNKNESFVNYIIDLFQHDKAIAASFRRKEGIDCWQILANFNIDVSKSYIRLPYITIGHAIAQSKVSKNGIHGIGKVLASCYDDGNKNDQVKSKLRRLIACDSTEELCSILRPILSLINSRSSLTLDYASLLSDLVKFNYDDNRIHIKSKWAQDCFNNGDYNE